MLLRSSLVSFWTFVSRILGLVRDVVLTGLLGAGVALDTFVVIMKIPSVFRRMFAEGAFNQAFVPVLSEYKETKSNQEVKDLINSTFGALSSVLIVVTIVALLAAPIFVMIFAPGFYLETLKRELAVDILQITFPYLFFISLVALSGAIMNTYERFSLPALTPLFYNLILIIAAVWVAPYYKEIPIYVIAWGVFSAGCLQVAIQIYPLFKMNLLPRFKLDLNNPGMRRVMLLMVPGIIAGGVSQLNMLVDTILASLLPTGSPSWLYVSDRLMQLPLGIFAIAIGTVILPRLASLHSSDNQLEFSKTLDWSLRLILLIGTPAALGLVALSEPIIMTLFERGEFGELDTQKTSMSLIALAVGLLAFMLIKVLTPGFFARQQPKKPVVIALISMILNGFLAWLLGFYLGLNHVGLALASSFSAFFTVFALLFYLKKENIYNAEKGWFLFLIRLLIACLLLYLCIDFFNQEISTWRSMKGVSRFLNLAILIGFGMFAYLSTLWILGLRQNDFKH